MKNLAPYIMIAILIAIIFIMRECNNPKPCPEPQTSHDTVTVIKDRIVEKYIDKPVPVIVIDSFPVNTVIDTAAILADYYKVRKYDIPLIDDSIACLSFEGTVYKNKLENTLLIGEIHERIKYVTKTVTIPEEKHRKVYAGLLTSVGIPSNSNNGITYFGIGAAALYQSRKDNAYSLSYDPFNRVTTGTVWFKIKLHSTK